MDSLPDAIVQYILSNTSNAKDVALCTCVSKRWKDSMRYLRSLYFPRNLNDNLTGGDTTDNIVRQMVSSMCQLEALVVYCPFTSTGLDSWLSLTGPSLRYLELRMDNLVEQKPCTNNPSKLDCIGAVAEFGVAETLGCSYDPLPEMEHCKLDFYGLGNCSLSLVSPTLECLEVQGCSWIRVPETQCLRNLSVANNSGRVYKVDFGKLVALDFLSIRGVQWCWDAISKMLQLANDVKHLYMKVEFTGDFDALLPFPEIDFVEFFNTHPKLQKFDMHGAMFAALCQKNSLKNVDSRFVIPCLEEMVITVRSPLNAEQKMNTLESLVKYGRNLKKMTIRILDMKSSHSSADDFFQDICRFRCLNRKIVSIE
ncbi:F-box/RNI-like superfamily protein [Actinidia rufa]|uniref:F-box/RNI-like superfamily protein n=1 Tax=Actinidia rufa TaxID=165716 RepID=A0A7J0ESL9_9ERIC|nr:F-box/RNI-like superfamily protein [Actinidia rufa]